MFVALTVEACSANGIADPARTAASAINAVSVCGAHGVNCPKSRLIQIFRLPCRALHCELCSNRAACMFLWSTRGHVSELRTPAAQVLWCTTGASRDFD